MSEVQVQVPAGRVTLAGALELPAAPCGVIVFAHGSGSGRFTRNQFVAGVLHQAGIGTLLLDLLTDEEEQDPSAVSTSRC